MNDPTPADRSLGRELARFGDSLAPATPHPSLISQRSGETHPYPSGGRYRALSLTAGLLIAGVVAAALLWPSDGDVVPVANVGREASEGSEESPDPALPNDSASEPAEAAAEIELAARELFGERLGIPIWDPVSGVLELPVVDLADGEAAAFEAAHADVMVQVTVSAADISLEVLRELNQAVKDRARNLLSELGVEMPRSIGISRELGVIVVSLPSENDLEPDQASALGPLRDGLEKAVESFLDERALGVEVSQVLLFEEGTPSGDG